MCCDADWKREVVPDHKFDFVNVREFHRTDFLTRIKYIWKYILILKALAVYGLDIFTAVTMISTNHWTNSIYSKCGDHCAITIQFSIAKWIFVGCIIFSFLLLGYEMWKARQVVSSRDISYAFTNLMANDFYSLRSYDNFCLFCHIDSSTKKKDDFAFFIFFTFKDWKRLLLADGPRQSINALTLYSFAYANGFETSNIPAYWDDSAVTAMLLFSMILTVLIFLGSLILLVAAGVLYIPLLCYIQGNLKEYVCHKVDKRISELIRKKQRQRVARNAAMEKKMAHGAVRNSKGEMVPGIAPQPTLPDVKLYDDDVALRAKRKAERAGMDIPPQPRGYEATEVYDRYGGYPPTVDYDPGHRLPYAGDEYGSSSHLVASAAPLGISYPPVVASRPSLPSYSSTPAPNPYAASQPDFPPSRSHSDLARGYAQPTQAYTYQRELPSSYGRNVTSPGSYERYSGLAYDEEPHYAEPQRGNYGGRYGGR